MLGKIWNKLYPPVPTEEHSTAETQAQASAALARAGRDYDTAVKNEPQVQSIVEKLRRQGERNHFGEMLEASMRKS